MTLVANPQNQFMETIKLISALGAILLIPLLPAYIIYSFLPSKTAVTGPFKGLHINLTGAFGGYFLLVIISVGLFYYLINNSLSKELAEANAKIDRMNDQLTRLTSEVTKEKGRYQKWKMVGKLDSQTPELTKIFIDEKTISINALGRFDVSMLIRTGQNKKFELPDAVCFFNKNEGYSVVDLSERDNVAVDSTQNAIQIKKDIKLKYMRGSKTEW